MHAPERLRGLRVVASPAALDAARWTAATSIVRVAPDEALAIDATGIELDDPDAIVVAETGFIALTVDAGVVAPHLEWPLPGEGTPAQGAVAGVPAKLTRLADGRVRVVTHAAYLDELVARLR